MLNNLKAKNRLPVFSVLDDEFNEYGKVLDDLDTAEIISVAEQFEMPIENSVYKPSVPEFECLNIADIIRNKYFGQTAAQLGFCYGYSSYLNALEWHSCNEINIAVTDAVLILAKRRDLENDNTMNSLSCKAFYVPKGTAIEVYSDTLHFCPCQVSDNGFRMVVGLSKDTNTPLDNKTPDPILWAKNKWLISHNDNESLIARGAFAGISGENYKILY